MNAINDFKKILAYPPIGKYEEAYNKGLITLHEFLTIVGDILHSIQRYKGSIETYTEKEIADSKLFGEIDIEQSTLVSPISEKQYQINICTCLYDTSYTVYVNNDSVLVKYFTNIDELTDYFNSLVMKDCFEKKHLCQISMTMDEWKKVEEREINKEAQRALDEHEAEYGADGYRWQASQGLVVY